MFAIYHVLLLALDAPGVHQLGLPPGDQHDGALLLEGAHKGAPAHLPQPTPAAQIAHQLHSNTASWLCQVVLECSYLPGISINVDLTVQLPHCMICPI